MFVTHGLNLSKNGIIVPRLIHIDPCSRICSRNIEDSLLSKKSVQFSTLNHFPPTVLFLWERRASPKGTLNTFQERSSNHCYGYWNHEYSALRKSNPQQSEKGICSQQKQRHPKDRTHSLNHIHSKPASYHVSQSKFRVYLHSPHSKLDNSRDSSHSITSHYS